MKTSYKIALAVCALILTGSLVYWAKNKFSKHATTETLADAGGAAAPGADLTAPPTGAPASAAPATSLASPAPGSPEAAPAVTVAPAGEPPVAPPPPATLAPAAPATATPSPATTVAPPEAPKPAPKVETAAPKPAAASKPAAGKTYTVRSGDTLTSISQKFFGDKKHGDQIYAANRKVLSSPDKLKIGMKLEIPAK